MLSGLLSPEVQLPLIPAYALTIHKTQATGSGIADGFVRAESLRATSKTERICLLAASDICPNGDWRDCISSLSQALSIKHTVQGCLEGVFAQGQVLGTSESHAHLSTA